jgi:hypothetical protein
VRSQFSSCSYTAIFSKTTSMRATQLCPDMQNSQTRDWHKQHVCRNANRPAMGCQCTNTVLNPGGWSDYCNITTSPSPKQANSTSQTWSSLNDSRHTSNKTCRPRCDRRDKHQRIVQLYLAWMSGYEYSPDKAVSDYCNFQHHPATPLSTWPTYLLHNQLPVNKHQHTLHV